MVLVIYCLIEYITLSFSKWYHFQGEIVKCTKSDWSFVLVHSFMQMQFYFAAAADYQVQVIHMFINSISGFILSE